MLFNIESCQSYVEIMEIGLHMFLKVYRWDSKLLQMIAREIFPFFTKLLAFMFSVFPYWINNFWQRLIEQCEQILIFENMS